MIARSLLDDCHLPSCGTDSLYDKGQWNIDLSPMNGPEWGPFPKHAEALTAVA